MSPKKPINPDRTVSNLITPAEEISPTTAADLRGSGYNPRSISPQKLLMLREAMKEFGDLGGIVFNRTTGRLISGHQRGKNLDKTWPITKEPHTDATGTVAIGYIETPEGKFSYREVAWDETKERAGNIAANRNGGEFDEELLAQLLQELSDGGYDMSLTGFDDAELKELLAGNRNEELGEEDPEVEPVEAPFVELGDLWICGEGRVLCGDSTKIDNINKLMMGEKAKCVWQDPPYNVDYASKNRSLNAIAPANRIQTPIENDSFATDALFMEFLTSAFSVMEQSMEKGACFYIACPVGMQETTFGNAIRESKNLKHAQSLIWVKNNHVLGMSDYQGKHEPIQYGWKLGAAHYFNQDFSLTTVIDDDVALNKLSKSELVKIAGELRQREPTTVIRVDKPIKSDLHSTMKPVRLVERCLYASSRPGDIVLDLFNGSGTTLIACRKMGRKYRGCELTPAYTQTTLKRYWEYCGEEPLLMDPKGKQIPFSQVEKQRAKK